MLSRLARQRLTLLLENEPASEEQICAVAYRVILGNPVDTLIGMAREYHQGNLPDFDEFHKFRSTDCPDTIPATIFLLIWRLLQRDGPYDHEIIELATKLLNKEQHLPNLSNDPHMHKLLSVAYLGIARPNEIPFEPKAKKRALRAITALADALHVNINGILAYLQIIDKDSGFHPQCPFGAVCALENGAAPTPNLCALARKSNTIRGLVAAGGPFFTIRCTFDVCAPRILDLADHQTLHKAYSQLPRLNTPDLSHWTFLALTDETITVKAIQELMCRISRHQADPKLVHRLDIAGHRYEDRREFLVDMVLTVARCRAYYVSKRVVFSWFDRRCLAYVERDSLPAATLAASFHQIEKKDTIEDFSSPNDQEEKIFFAMLAMANDRVICHQRIRTLLMATERKFKENKIRRLPPELTHMVYTQFCSHGTVFSPV